MKQFKAYLDLLRLHFLPAWPAIFCGGLFLGFILHGGFSVGLVVKAVLIAAFGFECGFILNDLIDVDHDKKDVEPDLTNYFRPFHTRPLANGTISVRAAWGLFAACFLGAVGLTLSLPFPHSLYVMAIGCYSFAAEAFYQLKKRRQSFPWSQLIGRTDFALFPVAGYLCVAHPDPAALLIFLFFYPLAEAHLGINDLIDVKNDRARGMKAIPILYGINGAKAWIAGFSLLHLLVGGSLLYFYGSVVPVWFLLGFILIIIANVICLQEKLPIPKLAALPLIHLTMFVYSLAVIFR
ncbi:MAG: UbiA family prenyltransferase [Candidatus Margulisiibacteriota bacterium]